MVTGIWKTPQISDSRSFLAPFVLLLTNKLFRDTMQISNSCEILRGDLL